MAALYTSSQCGAAYPLSGGGPSHRHRQVAAELLDKIHRYTGVDPALAIQELGVVVERHDRPVPDVRMDVETAAAVTPESDELLGCHIVAGQRQRHHKTLAMQRVEKLTAVGMVIGTPHQRLLPRFCRAVGRCLFRPVAPGEEVAVADGVVTGVEGFAFPPKFEDPLGDATLIARILVDLSPALRRPTDDLDREALRRVNEAAIAHQVLLGGGNEPCRVHLPHAGGRHVGYLRRIKILHGASHDDAYPRRLRSSAERRSATITITKVTISRSETSWY